MPLPRTPSFRLDDRRALVTGASSGIGLGCAVALAEAGAEVTLVARGAEKLDAVAAEMAEAGFAVRTLPLDISDIAATEAAVAAQGPFDVLVNSAGLARHGPALETDPADFDAVTDVNLRAAYFLTRAVARGLIAAGRPGSLINVSSQMGHVGGRERALYCATKHGLEGMTKAMAIEWAPHGIRVNTLCPTFIRTPLGAQTLEDPEKRAWIEGMIKLGRVGEVEDVMGAVAYLASPASALVTGTALLIDGGWTAD
ncbi:SDR family NAD(P)-dependent oxidoreductase [Limimaricola pyoseonensis]|uniref:NAD(P)-dependent dehydrogenase, short-chain alcohol dehydrogenase family n=1 Tax=Limimaricola pyoseonensis TaxID=521013 RepID=A0A1G7HS35_9RHOB|nr:SDR family oxidoreductase [Limimaricola pyoseonensis]SDF03337.1 NAD(P)-dependent dehydrogenase, short-chain alcohol dehydrogenase family [Limimaricola pyoseonensis]